MKRMIVIIFFIFILLSLNPAQAKLINNGNNLIYDDVLNITWYDYTFIPPSSETYSWDQAMNWASNLSVADAKGNVFTDWRLPTATVPETSFEYDPAVDSELGYLYSVLKPVSGTLNSDGLFSNLQLWVYWTSTIDPSYTGPPPGKAYAFSFLNGGQGAGTMNLPYYALAVHDGNIGAKQIPEPGILLLLAAGFAGLMIARRNVKGKR